MSAALPPVIEFKGVSKTFNPGEKTQFTAEEQRAFEKRMAEAGIRVLNPEFGTVLTETEADERHGIAIAGARQPRIDGHCAFISCQRWPGLSRAQDDGVEAGHASAPTMSAAPPRATASSRKAAGPKPTTRSP